MTKKSFALIVIGQISIIGYLTWYIFTYNKPGVLSVSTSSENIKSTINLGDSELKYYYALSPSETITETRYWDNTKATLTINDDGLNERFNYSIVKPTNTYRIITIGDSFTYGIFVNTNLNWTELLEQKLNESSCYPYFKIEVINLAVHGHDIAYITKRYKDLGIKYNPDLIIYYESSTGFFRDMEKMMPLINACRDRIIQKKGKDDISTQEISQCWADIYSDINKNTPIEEVEKRVRSQLENLMEVRGQTPLLIITNPNLEPPHRQILIELASNNNNLYFSDSLTDVSINNQNVFPDGHPNESGHDRIAKDIFNYVTSEDKFGLNCNSN